MDVQGVLTAGLVLFAHVLGLILGHRMGQGREPITIPVFGRKRSETYEEEAGWARRERAWGDDETTTA